MLKFYCIQILQQHLENTSSMGSSHLWPESHVAYLKFITTSYLKKNECDIPWEFELVFHLKTEKCDDNVKIQDRKNGQYFITNLTEK